MYIERQADKYESNACGMTDDRGEVFDAGYLHGLREAAAMLRAPSW